MDDVCEGKDFSFPNQEEKILEWWSQINAFETQLERTKHLPEYIFYDGPPFATGLPHYGHILAGTIKDIVTRYQTMTGHHVTRRFGWDCHGLPVEHEIDIKLGIKTREDVLKMGIGNYNEECRSIVTRYVGEWEKVITRTGRWIDFKNDYKTMDLKFMESVWWVFSQLHKKGLVYRGFKVMPYSTGCKTPLSNFEANSNYKEVPDPEIMVSFPVVDAVDGAAFVAWTTTPWTLPSNLALCVNANFVYLKVRNKFNEKIYIVAESRLSELPIEKAKKGLPNGAVNDPKNSDSKTKGSSGGKTKSLTDTYEVLDKFSGASLIGTNIFSDKRVQKILQISQAAELEIEAYPLLDELTSKISTLNLERVRRLKSRLVALTRRVQKVRDEIEQLMDDDGDMAEMYLTEKKRRMESSSFYGDQSVIGYRSNDGALSVSAPVTPVSSPPDGRKLEKSLSMARSRHESMRSSESVTDSIEELEMLLEAYFVVIDSTLNKLTSLKEYIDDTEDFINIQLDNVRNQLIQFELLLTTATFVVAIFGVVAGIFGMNFTIPIFDDPGAFKWVLIITGITGVVIFSTFLWFFKYRRLMPL